MPIVRGGQEDIIYRGWPLTIELRRVSGDDKTPLALTVVGPTQVDPQPAPRATGVWLINEDQSKSLAAGKYIFSVGAIHSEVEVVDEPPTLSPAQKSAKQVCRISYAMAAADFAQAEKLAREWVKADAQSVEAQATLGDVLGGSGKLSDALDAYNEAISRIGPGGKAPRSLYKRASAIQTKLANQTTTRPAASASPQEEKYYKLIAEGDAALAAKKDAAALRAYENARKFQEAQKLPVKDHELDEKIDLVRQRLATPAKSPPPP